MSAADAAASGNSTAPPPPPPCRLDSVGPSTPRLGRKLSFGPTSGFGFASLRQEPPPALPLAAVAPTAQPLAVVNGLRIGWPERGFVAPGQTKAQSAVRGRFPVAETNAALGDLVLLLRALAQRLNITLPAGLVPRAARSLVVLPAGGIGGSALMGSGSTTSSRSGSSATGLGNASLGDGLPLELYISSSSIGAAGRTKRGAQARERFNLALVVLAHCVAAIDSAVAEKTREKNEAQAPRSGLIRGSTRQLFAPASVNSSTIALGSLPEDEVCPDDADDVPHRTQCGTGVAPDAQSPDAPPAIPPGCVIPPFPTAPQPLPASLRLPPVPPMAHVGGNGPTANELPALNGPAECDGASLLLPVGLPPASRQSSSLSAHVLASSDSRALRTWTRAMVGLCLDIKRLQASAVELQ
jgi:hypothetical protein